MTLADTLNSEHGLTLIGSIVGGLWTLFKTSEWVLRLRAQRFDRAVRALEAAVEETYRTYVQAIKAGREDGKLTPEERRRARELARQRAIEFGRTDGVDVLRELGETYLDLWITRLVNGAKGMNS